MSRIRSHKVLKIIAGTIAGEVLLVLLTTFVQEVLYDGISYTYSPITDIIFGGAGTMLAAVLAGAVASLVAGKNSVWPSLLISIIICAEMTYLITRGRTSDPVWFDTMAGLSLIAGIWLGYYIIRRLQHHL